MEMKLSQHCYEKNKKTKTKHWTPPKKKELSPLACDSVRSWGCVFVWVCVWSACSRYNKQVHWCHPSEPEGKPTVRRSWGNTFLPLKHMHSPARWWWWGGGGCYANVIWEQEKSLKDTVNLFPRLRSKIRGREVVVVLWTQTLSEVRHLPQKTIFSFTELSGTQFHPRFTAYLCQTLFGCELEHLTLQTRTHTCAHTHAHPFRSVSV